jgi:hypothetical protein
MVKPAFKSGRGRLPISISIAAALLAKLSVLHAAAEDPVAQAALLYDMATKALRVHDYATAARLYEQAYAIERNPSTLMAIGKCNYMQYQQSSNTKCACDAIRQLSEYIECAKGASDATTAAFIKEAQDRLDNLKPVIGDAPNACEAAKPALPPPTKVMVSSDTPGVTYQIDSELVMSSPAIVEVSPGEHNLTVSAKGYQPVRRRIAVEKGQIYTADINLVPLPGVLKVDANEMGAEVYVDGLKVGTTPFTGNGFIPGGHFVSVRKAGRNLWTSNLDLAPEGTSSTTALLEPTRQRTQSSYVLLGAGVSFGVGLVSALVAYSIDSSLNDGTSVTNQQRADFDSALHTRNAFATASTVALIISGAALVAGGSMYWFDTPPVPAAHGDDGVHNQKAASFRIGPEGLRF